MAIRYILHGGNIEAAPDKGRAFYETVSGGRQRLLLCYYALPRSDWEAWFGYHNLVFRSLGISTPLEMAEPQLYPEQVTRNDAMIILDGDSDVLYYRLNMSTDSIRAWKGKTVAAVAVGAEMLMKYYWSLTWRKVREGLGVMPDNLVAHYGSNYGLKDPRGPIDWQKAEAELQAEVGAGNAILKLREGEFITIEK